MQKIVFFISIALCFLLAGFVYSCIYGGLVDKIFVALAVNNVLQEFGFGDPRKFDAHEFVIAGLIILLMTYSYYQNKVTHVGRNSTPQ